jgi:hypothetical protein
MTVQAVQDVSIVQLSRITAARSHSSLSAWRRVWNIKCFLLKIIPVVKGVADNSLSPTIPASRVWCIQISAGSEKEEGFHR